MSPAKSTLADRLLPWERLLRVDHLPMPPVRLSVGDTMLLAKFLITEPGLGILEPGLLLGADLFLGI